MDFYYTRADEAVSAFAGVSASNVDDTYVAASLCDMQPGKPLRVTTTSLSATITPLAAGEVGLIAVGHHNIRPEWDITFGGDISAVLETNPAPIPDGIPFNPWMAITPVAGVDNVTVAVTGNDVPVVIGEIIFGKRRSLPMPPYPGHAGQQRRFARPPDMDLASIRGYDPRLAARVWNWTCVYTSAQLEEILLVYRAQRNETRPTLIVPDILKNDAWISFITEPQYSIHEPGIWDVSFTIVEVPRLRW